MHNEMSQLNIVIESTNLTQSDILYKVCLVLNFIIILKIFIVCAVLSGSFFFSQAKPHRIPDYEDTISTDSGTGPPHQHTTGDPYQHITFVLGHNAVNRPYSQITLHDNVFTCIRKILLRL
jgi:hypothetical protein